MVSWEVCKILKNISQIFTLVVGGVKRHKLCTPFYVSSHLSKDAISNVGSTHVLINLHKIQGVSAVNRFAVEKYGNPS